MAGIEANWVIIGLAVALLLLAGWLLRRGARGRDRFHAPDALDEGVGPAQRNEALIKAPSATATVDLGTATAPAAIPQDGDDLTRIKGLGPKLRSRLAELGVTHFAQIAAWTPQDIAAMDAQLGSFAGRATRDRWVEQAGFLASGDVAGYEAVFGKL